MNDTTIINKEVNIVAYYFHNKGRRLRCFPKSMEWNSRRITFTETGMVHPTTQGQRTLHMFDMTDSNADYRLEFDALALTWTLISISDTNYANATPKSFAIA